MLDETAENMHRNFGSGYPGGEKAAILCHDVSVANSIVLAINLVMFSFV